MGVRTTAKMLVVLGGTALRAGALGAGAAAGGALALATVGTAAPLSQRWVAVVAGATAGVILAEAVSLSLRPAVDGPRLPGLKRGLAASVGGGAGLLVSGAPGMMTGAFLGALVGEAV